MWKDIINYEGLYKINEYGDIYSIISDKIIQPYISNKGYKLICLSKDGIRKKFSVHKLVAIHFVPNPENKPIVLHKDNIKTNTYYQNLVWGTYSENNSQAIRDGLNSIPKPDNRKHYLLYNDNNDIICYGLNMVIDQLEFGTDSGIRNYIFRNSEIKTGPYTGYKIKRINPICPIEFDENFDKKRSTIIS